MIRFRKRELRHGSIELQLKPLQENRVINTAFFAAPAEDAVSENQLNALAFTLDAAIECVKTFKNFHRCSRGLFRSCPFISLQLPMFKVLDSGRVVRKLH